MDKALHNANKSQNRNQMLTKLLLATQLLAPLIIALWIVETNDVGIGWALLVFGTINVAVYAISLLSIIFLLKMYQRYRFNKFFTAGNIEKVTIFVSVLYLLATIVLLLNYLDVYF
jgi:hypothetical protein